jgi:hypothetical protein
MRIGFSGPPFACEVANNACCEQSRHSIGRVITDVPDGLRLIIDRTDAVGLGKQGGSIKVTAAL